MHRTFRLMDFHETWMDDAEVVNAQRFPAPYIWKSSCSPVNTASFNYNYILCFAQYVFNLEGGYSHFRETPSTWYLVKPISWSHIHSWYIIYYLAVVAGGTFKFKRDTVSGAHNKIVTTQDFAPSLKKCSRCMKAFPTICILKYVSWSLRSPTIGCFVPMSI